MDKKALIDQRIDILDAVYTAVKELGPLTSEALFAQQQTLLSAMDVRSPALNMILLSMEHDGYLLKDGEDRFYINAMNTSFLTFRNKHLSDLKKQRFDKAIEIIFKIIPIFLTIVFGIATFTLSLSNYNLSRQKQESKTPQIVLETDSIFFKQPATILSKDTAAIKH